ncbi:MAG: succinate dehydrogenase assembly factor 2 [Nitrosomonadales bacterium]|nr:succinate dehydrogenase assembly factor 2 [Nitrosomonadales bacterium]
MLHRLLWRCRRGLLELDLVLEHFVVHCYAGLAEDELEVFHVLLEKPDQELWDMIAGRVAPPDEFRAVLEKLKA